MVRTMQYGARALRAAAFGGTSRAVYRPLDNLRRSSYLHRIASSFRPSFADPDLADGQFREGGRLSPGGIAGRARRPGRGCLPPLIARQGLARDYLQRGDCPAGVEPVAKVIGRVAGDTVEVKSGWVAVNGIRFANSSTAAHDSAGRPLMHVPSGAYRVSADQVWLFGFNNRRSWDARYFGPVPAINVRGVLRPLVTW
jgi:hypothetical protein